MLLITLDVLVLWKPEIVVEVGYDGKDEKAGREVFSCVALTPSRDGDDDEYDDSHDDDEVNVVRVAAKALNCKLSTNAAETPTSACDCGKATATTVIDFVIVSGH